MTPTAFTTSPAYELTKSQLGTYEHPVSNERASEWLDTVSALLKYMSQHSLEELAPEWDCPENLASLFRLAGKRIGSSPHLTRAVSSSINKFVNHPPSLLLRQNCVVSIDRFSSRLAGFKNALLPAYNGQELQFLEIGGFTEGLSSRWLLENVLTHEAAGLISIDEDSTAGQHTFLFEQNMARSAVAHKCTILRGYIATLIESLKNHSFDVIYIAGVTGRWRANVLEFALRVWPFLKPNGLLIFDDYPDQVSLFHQMSPQWVSAASQVRRFLKSYLPFLGSRTDMIEQHGYQIVVRKPC